MVNFSEFRLESIPTWDQYNTVTKLIEQIQPFWILIGGTNQLMIELLIKTANQPSIIV